MGQSVEKIVRKVHAGCSKTGIAKTGWTVFLFVCCVMLLTLIRYEKDWSEQEFATGWCITIMGLIAFCCVVGEKCITKWCIIDTLVTTGIAYYIVNIVFLSHSPVAHQVIITMECEAIYIFARLIIGSKRSTKVIVYVMAAAGVFECVVGLQQLIGGVYIGHAEKLMTGTFLNPGPMGIYIAVMLSACTCYYHQTHDRVVWWSMIPMLIIMPATGSRTALLAYGVVGVLLYRSLFLRHWKICMVVILGIVAGLYFVRQGSADSRVLMNMVALNEWKGHPWWGCGVGGYIQTLAQGQMQYFAAHPESKFVYCVGVTDMAFNEYVKVMVEQGVIGIVLMLNVVGWSIWRLYKEQSPITGAMTALCVAAMFSYPFELFPFMILASWFVAMAAGCKTIDCDWSLGKKDVAIMCVIITTGLTITLNREVNRRKKIVMDAEIFSNTRDAVFIDHFYELLPDMNDNREFLFRFAKILRETGRYNDSNAILRMEAQLDTDPIVYVVMGRNYEDMNLYAEADRSYLQAFFLQPNRIYPLYRQMKLYERIGDNIRMNQKAMEIMTFTPKVASPATTEMKDEARQLLLRRQH